MPRASLRSVLFRIALSPALIGGEGFAVDASLIKADANRQRPSPDAKDLSSPTASRAVGEYLAAAINLDLLTAAERLQHEDFCVAKRPSQRL